MTEATETKEAPTTKPLDYVMVYHMGYSAETRTERKLKSGSRRNRFILDNGRRIRGKGDRPTEVSFDALWKNFNTFLKGVREGHVQVCRPDNMEPFTLAQLADLGLRLKADFKSDSKIDETLLEPLTADLTDTKVWVEKPKDPPEGEDDESKNHKVPADSGNQDEESEEEVVEEYTEEQLKEMTRPELNDLAADLGVEHPEKLGNKQLVVDAILLKASEGKE